MIPALIKTAICFLLMGAVGWGASSEPGSAQKGGASTRPRSGAGQGAPVVFDGKTLFSLREKVLSYTPDLRAQAVSDRLARLAKDPLLQPDKIRIDDTDFTSDIVIGDQMIMVVTEMDAAREGKTRAVLAHEYAAQMRSALQKFIDERSAQHLLLASLYALLATVVGALLIVAIIRGLRKIPGIIESWHGTTVPAQQRQSVDFVIKRFILPLAAVTIKALRVVLIFAVFYCYISLVFSFFPGTRDVAETVFGYTQAPFQTIWQSFKGYLPDLLLVVVIVVITWSVMHFIRIVFAEIGSGAIAIPGFDPDWTGHTSKIVNFMVAVLATIIAFPYLPGSKSEAFKGISIFLGVLFSLGSTSSVANIMAGFILTYTNAFKIGDRIGIGENVGDVVAKSLLTTRINTPKNVLVTIPNSVVIGSYILNYSEMARKESLILHSSITIGYDAPWRTVHGLLIAAASSTERVLGTPAPFVLQTALNDFYVTYELNAHTDQPLLMMQTYSELHQNIQDKFNEAGVEIMSPHYAQIRDGNKTTIPDSYLPVGYQAGSIRLTTAAPLDAASGNQRDNNSLRKAERST